MTPKLRTDELDWKQIDDEVVALDSRAGVYLALNGSGALLWLKLASGATRDDLARSLIQSYGIDEQRANADVDEFLSSLSEQGLLIK